MTEPKPPGRRATNRAARAAFTAARNRGLVTRHRLKLQHLAERGITPLRPLDPSESETQENPGEDLEPRPPRDAA